MIPKLITVATLLLIVYLFGMRYLPGRGDQPVNGTPAVGGSDEALPPAISQRPSLTGKLWYFSRQRGRGELRVRNLSDQTEQVKVSDPKLLSVIHSGDRFILTLSKTPSQVEVKSYHISSGSTEPLITINSPVAAPLVRLSPSGRQLAYIGNQAAPQLEVVSVSSGKPIRTIPLGGEVASLTFLNEETVVATVGTPPRFTLQRINLTSRTVETFDGITGGTLAPINDDQLYIALFNDQSNTSQIVQFQLSSKKITNQITKGPFDDFPLPLQEGLLFHRLRNDAAGRTDQLILQTEFGEEVVTLGLIPLFIQPK